MCTANLTSFILPAAWVVHVTLILNLNDSESTILSFGSALQYCY